MTANSDARDQPEAEAAGATAFLTKPMGSVELLATVQRALLLRAGQEERVGKFVVGSS